MAEPTENSLDVPVPWSQKPLHVSGTLAIALIVFFATGWYFRDLINSGFADREKDMKQIICNQSIEIFIHQFPRGAVDWELLPPTVYSCLPGYQRKLKDGK